MNGETENSDARTAVPALIQDAEQLWRCGNYTSAGALIERAVVLARRCADPQILGSALVSRSRIQSMAGHELSAYEAASEAYDLLTACGDVSGQLRALSLLATVFSLCGDTANDIATQRRGLSLAIGRDHLAIRCVLLHNLAATLSDRSEHEEALECLVELVDIASREPKLAPDRDAFSARLALEHQRRAGHLRQHGREAEAQKESRAAADGLPPLRQRPLADLSERDAYGLRVQAEVRAGLGQWSAARSAAATSIRFARRGTGAVVSVAAAFTAAAKLCRSQQQLDQAIRFENRALATWRTADLAAGILESLQRLSELHAASGTHDQALALRREAAARQNRSRREAGLLRCRLAAIERQAERRRRHAQEAAAHARRLAIIGRLVAQTHHALSAPITETCRLAAQTLAFATSREALRPLLDEISQAIDRAAGLASQLKLFSYRSSPQPMTLSLHEALLEAWQGLDTHVGSGRTDLHVSGRTQLQVWGDAQRLGIMLKVLLIELMQQACPSGAQVVIGAHIDAGDAGTVVLHIEACGGAMPCATAAAPASLGAALCMEIAAEMQGELRSAHADAPTPHHTPHHMPHQTPHQMPRYRLRLPDAQGRSLHLTQTPALAASLAASGGTMPGAGW